MPLDAICLRALTNELKGQLLGARIDKVQQPERDLLLLSVRTQSGNAKLLVHGGVGSARVHFTAGTFENPAEPPMFCMLLRKYLSGGKILELRQPPAERLAELVIEATNEMGDKVRRRLILEMMGRRTNLLLLDGEDRIVDCLRRVEGDLTQARPLLPGMFYHLPDPQPGKKDPNRLTEEDRAARSGSLRMRCMTLRRCVPPCCRTTPLWCSLIPTQRDFPRPSCSIYSAAPCRRCSAAG